MGRYVVMYPFGLLRLCRCFCVGDGRGGLVDRGGLVAMLFEWIVGRLERVVGSRGTLVEYPRILHVVRVSLWRDSLSRRGPCVSMRVGGLGQ